VKVRVKTATHEREKGFEEGEAKTILAATLVPPSQKISTEMAAARRFIPWICAYSGARVNEITCLTGRDFIVRDGIPMMRIRAETNKTRKWRIVPLHSHLVEQGLLEYVKSRGARPLFYDPKGSRGGSAANPHFKKVGERLAEWVRSLGIDSRVAARAAKIEIGTVAPNHGWRHRFKTECRRISMDREVRLYIQGHAFRMEGEKYGFFPVDVTSAWMDLFPRYDVDRSALIVERTGGKDEVHRALALLHKERSSAPDKAA
jgi:integrase